MDGGTTKPLRSSLFFCTDNVFSAWNEAMAGTATHGRPHHESCVGQPVRPPASRWVDAVCRVRGADDDTGRDFLPSIVCGKQLTETGKFWETYLPGGSSTLSVPIGACVSGWRRPCSQPACSAASAAGPDAGISPDSFRRLLMLTSVSRKRWLPGTTCTKTITSIRGEDLPQ